MSEQVNKYLEEEILMQLSIVLEEEENSSPKSAEGQGERKKREFRIEDSDVADQAEYLCMYI